MGHILCLEVFGPPSPEEAAAGITFHGEAADNTYQVEAGEPGCVSRLVRRIGRLAVAQDFSG